MHEHAGPAKMNNFTSTELKAAVRGVQSCSNVGVQPLTQNQASSTPGIPQWSSSVCEPALSMCASNTSCAFDSICKQQIGQLCAPPSPAGQNSAHPSSLIHCMNFPVQYSVNQNKQKTSSDATRQSHAAWLQNNCRPCSFVLSGPPILCAGAWQSLRGNLRCVAVGRS